MENTREDNRKFISSLIGLVLVAVFALIVHRSGVLKNVDANEIKEYVQSYGVWAPIIYLLIMALLAVVVFPDAVVVMAGGMVFGLVKGTILTSIGSFIGASIEFFMARKLGKEVVKKFIKKDIVAFDSKTREEGFNITLLLRLIPLFPFKVVSYSAGISNVSYRDFGLATLIGAFPGIIVYTNLGDKTTDIGSRDFYIALGLLVALLLGSLIFKKIFEKKGLGGKIKNADEEIKK